MSHNLVPVSTDWCHDDGKDHRVDQYSSKGNGSHIYYLPGNGEEVTPSGSLIKYYTAGGLSIGENTARDASGSGIGYLVSDGLGSVTETLNSSGTTTGQQLTWDNEGWLVAWQNAPTSPTSTDQYLYDGKGNRVEQQVTSGSTTTTIVYIGNPETVVMVVTGSENVPS